MKKSLFYLPIITVFVIISYACDSGTGASKTKVESEPEELIELSGYDYAHKFADYHRLIYFTFLDFVALGSVYGQPEPHKFRESRLNTLDSSINIIKEHLKEFKKFTPDEDNKQLREDMIDVFTSYLKFLEEDYHNLIMLETDQYALTAEVLTEWSVKYTELQEKWANVNTKIENILMHEFFEETEVEIETVK